ncbi:MAG: F0F1 ATP synthase subunit B [Lachnospiraceae bacterium]|jgi:F-type H+-transporting ATPase subunit b|nr:F0F1 ATP synthase subunit B [Lachnospiraceae bacterium]MBQ2577589.1 F0F1 ATP synthase subunit B [Lachnospiraceae bacterium]MBQ5484525.1 F0F1 ATP synthase subunit B [Lachnospiraceae bacterium]MCR4732625.1 F0F1 ATP synthase subunit B [Lachnospiraceae bacterium]
MTGYNLLVNIDWQTIVIQLINLFIQVLLFKKFLYKPVMNVLQKRQNLVDAPIKEAENAKKEALELKDQYEQSLAGASEEASRIIKEATTTANAKSEKIVNDAVAEAAAIKQQTEVEVEQQKKRAIAGAKEEIGSMAMGIASKVIGREITEEDHKDLVDEFILKVGE